VAPISKPQAAKILAQTVLPPGLVRVAQTLEKAGFEAVVVGGAVRDALLGRTPGDWDLATSARPEEVQKLFPKTIPTGLEHGTVTVIEGRGKDRFTTEVTTYRGEGEYLDGRRPSEVQFLRDLAGDLARRDLTVNAFAYNPIRSQFTDCFEGLRDLDAGVIRAVGKATERFSEDGLRAMRAARFCATLEFDLEPETEAAIAGALPILEKVSRERVRVELVKMLAAARPSRGLRPMLRTGMWPIVLASLPEETCNEAIAAVDAMPPEPIVRLARLLWPIRDQRDAVEGVLDQLKPSREEKARVLSLLSSAADDLVGTQDPVAIRRAAARLGRKHLNDALDVAAVGEAHRRRVTEACNGAALTIGELEVGGKELIAGGLAKPGKALGTLLRSLLGWVHEDPTRNTAEALISKARELVS